MTLTKKRKSARTIQGYKEFCDELKKRGNGESKNCKFVCVSCGNVQCGQDFIDRKIKDRRNYVYMSCIGRRGTAKGGCDRTLGGLFQIHTKSVETEKGNMVPVFEFYDEPQPDGN